MLSTLPEPLLVRLSELLDTRLGLHFPRGRWADLERGISDASSRLGLPSAESFVRQLLEAPLRPREIEILADCLTVGETYFFREKPSLDALEHQILPELLRTRADGQKLLRIWSAGCCTGEEPYTIAMLLDRFIPNSDAWNITLLGTDINLAFLRKAAKAEYGEWSFRSTPAWIKDGYFRPVHSGRYKLAERIRKRVTFARLNLADDDYPAPVDQRNSMDIIFCRNVLMYFSAERARAVVDNFYRVLADDGWLIVSPAETSSVLFSRFTTVEFDGAILYRKNTSADAPRFVSHAPAAVTESLQASWCLSDENISPAEAFSEPLPVTSTGTDSDDVHVPNSQPQDQFACAARDCANQGRLDEAVDWSRKAIAANKLDPAQYYLLSAIQQEQGLDDEAAQSLTRALYLSPDFVMGHYALGILRQSQGRSREAQKHFDNALASLRTLPPDAILPDADGLAAGRLMELILLMRSNVQ